MTENVDRYKAYAAQLLRNPDDPIALVDQFSHLSNKGNKAKAKYFMVLSARAYNASQDEPNTIFNFASALHRAGEFLWAAKLYERLLNMGKEEWTTRCLQHLGISYRAMGENAKAVEYYSRAIAREPSADLRKDRAIAMMANGQLVDGLREFEARREVAEQKYRANNNEPLTTQQKLPPNARHWQGEDLTGKTIVVFHEEGQGDFIQFCRFIPKLRFMRNPARILLTGVVPNLLEMVSDHIQVDGIVPVEKFEADYVIGSMSLPWRLGVELKDVTGAPYMLADRPATFPRRGKLNIGLVWRGNPAYNNDANRSMPFEEMCSLFDIPGVAFYSLQVGPAASEVTQLGMDGFVADLAPFAKDWRATVRLVANLDAIVSVDTAVAHLAGAMGKPVCMLTTKGSDWRWSKDSTRSVWYDSMIVLHQHEQGLWWHPLQRVHRHLEEWLDGRSGQTADRDSEGPSGLVAAE